MRWQGLELLNFKKVQKMNTEQNVDGLNVSPAIAKPMLPAVYPLIDNKRWYAENGTVYNKADDEYRILLVAGKGSEISLPNDVAEKIAEYLNGT